MTGVVGQQPAARNREVLDFPRQPLISGPEGIGRPVPQDWPGSGRGSCSVIDHQRLLGKLIQPAGLDVGLDLRVPEVGAQFGDEVGEFADFVGRECPDFAFEFFELWRADRSRKRPRR